MSEYQNNLFGCHEQLHSPICLSHHYIVAIQSSLHGVDFHRVDDFWLPNKANTCWQHENENKEEMLLQETKSYPESICIELCRGHPPKVELREDAFLDKTGACQPIDKYFSCWPFKSWPASHSRTIYKVWIYN
jgi:hypothetical protein